MKTIDEFLSSTLIHDFLDNYHVSDEEIENDPVFDGECKSCYALYKLRGLAEEENYLELSDEELEELWVSFGDVPINDRDEIEETWRQFSKGTSRFIVWQWFDSKHTKGIQWLMYRRYK